MAPGGQAARGRADRARRRAGLRRRDMGLAVRHRPVRVSTVGQGRAARRLEPAAAASTPAVEHVAASRSPGTREQVLRRLPRHDDHPAASAPQPGGRDSRSRPRDRCRRLDALDRAADRPRLGVPRRRSATTGRPSSRPCPAISPTSCRPRASRPARYDLVVDPSNLWLTIHESIGHATELDRALGYEANYAGTSFATVDKLGTPRVRLRVPQRHRRPSRRARSGDHRVRRRRRRRAAVGPRQATASSSATRPTGGWPTLMGWERSTAARSPTRRGHIPIQRMANVSLQPGAEALSTADLIRRVDRGVYIVGDRSWSIDMQRYNFQFTGQRFFEIRDGAIHGQLRDVAYQATTTDFWGAMEAVGGARDLGARRGLQLRQGSARPGRRRQPRLPERPVPRHPDPQHERRAGTVSMATPQELVDCSPRRQHAPTTAS